MVDAMDLANGMQVYDTVVETGSLVGASKVIGISGAVISRQIAALGQPLRAHLLILRDLFDMKMYRDRAMRLKEQAAQAERVLRGLY